MTKFWELFERSVILQALLAVLLVGAVIYQIVTGQEPHEQLLQMTFLVLGFYFGGKVENRKITGAVKRMMNGESK